MKLKLFSLALSLLMLTIPLLTACGGGSGGSQTAATTPALTKDETDVKEVYDQEVKNLQGHEFYFLVQDRTASHLQLNEIYAEAMTGDKVNDAVYSRNAKLAETYNCSISEERVADPISHAREILSAGEYVYDFIFCLTKNLRSLSAAGLMTDFMKLKNVQLDKAWYSQGFIEGLQINGRLFYLTGDASTIDDRATAVIYFNRDILDQNKQGDPYELVDSGKWTVQALYDMSEACAYDTDGDGVWTPGSKDVFAYMCGVQGDYAHVACSGGLYIANMTGAGKFVIPGVVKEEILDAWGQLKPLLTSPHRDCSSSGTTFRTGGGAFYAVNLAAVLNWSNVAISFGILPFPKLNEQQEKYYTIVGNQVDGSFGIPATVDNMDETVYKNAGFESGKEFCGYFFNAFSYYSRQTLTPAFFEEVMKKQMMQDETAVRMLELTLENKFYDPVYFFDFGNLYRIFNLAGTGGGEIVTDTNYDNLVSLYNERYLSARTALNKYLEALETIENEENL